MVVVVLILIPHTENSENQVALVQEDILRQEDVRVLVLKILIPIVEIHELPKDFVPRALISLSPSCQ